MAAQPGHEGPSNELCGKNRGYSPGILWWRLAAAWNCLVFLIYISSISLSYPFSDILISFYLLRAIWSRPGVWATTVSFLPPWLGWLDSRRSAIDPGRVDFRRISARRVVSSRVVTSRSLGLSGWFDIIRRLSSLKKKVRGADRATGANSKARRWMVCSASPLLLCDTSPAWIHLLVRYIQGWINIIQRERALVRVVCLLIVILCAKLIYNIYYACLHEGWNLRSLGSRDNVPELWTLLYVFRKNIEL